MQDWVNRQKHTISPISRQRLPAGVGTPTQSHPFNIGVRLYQKGIKRMEERDRFCREVKAEEERRVEEELIFQPQIVTRYYQSDKTHNAGKKEEELMLYGRMLNEKKEMARIINDQYEESKFNFVPKINRKSERIVNDKQKYGNPSCFSNQGPLSPGQSDHLHSPKQTIKNLEDQMKYIGMTNQSNPQPSHSPVHSHERGGVLSPKSGHTVQSAKERKFLELYEEAMKREERKKKVETEIMDKECTFKPHLITKESRLT